MSLPRDEAPRTALSGEANPFRPFRLRPFERAWSALALPPGTTEAPGPGEASARSPPIAGRPPSGISKENQYERYADSRVQLLWR